LELVLAKDDFGAELMGTAVVVDGKIVNLGPGGVDIALEYKNVCNIVVVVSNAVNDWVDADIAAIVWEFLVPTVDARVVGKASMNVDICVETLMLLLTSLVVENTLTVPVVELDDKSMVPRADVEVLSSHVMDTSTEVEVACRGRRVDTEYSWFEFVVKLLLEVVKAPVKRSVRNTDEVANGDEAEKNLKLEGFLAVGVVSWVMVVLCIGWRESVSKVFDPLSGVVVPVENEKVPLSDVADEGLRLSGPTVAPSVVMT
jgi:hypothetical protein